MSQSVGYARAAGAQGDLEAQVEQLRAAGVNPIHAEDGAGLPDGRTQLAAALAALCEGDTLLVTAWDRLRRDYKVVMALIGEMQARGVNVVACQDSAWLDGEVVRLVFDLYTEGASAEQIAKRLNYSGIRPHRMKTA